MIIFFSNAGMTEIDFMYGHPHDTGILIQILYKIATNSQINAKSFIYVSIE